MLRRLQGKTSLNLGVAMRLYNLEKSELFWEKALDTKMLMAWNDNSMVLAFRGTASVANALADLQVSGRRFFLNMEAASSSYGQICRHSAMCKRKSKSKACAALQHQYEIHVLTGQASNEFSRRRGG